MAENGPPAKIPMLWSWCQLLVNRCRAGQARLPKKHANTYDLFRMLWSIFAKSA